MAAPSPPGPAPVPQFPANILDYSGSINGGGTAQLVLPMDYARSYFEFVNNSNANMYLEFGPARATANLTTTSGNTSIGTLTVTNAGFGYTYAPNIVLLGGGGPNNKPDGATSTIAWRWNSPSITANAHVTIGSGSISTLIIDYGGSGYVTTPYIMMVNDPRDPFGCAKPTASTGVLITPGGSYTMTNTFVTTAQVAVYGGTTGQQFACKVA